MSDTLTLSTLPQFGGKYYQAVLHDGDGRDCLVNLMPSHLPATGYTPTLAIRRAEDVIRHAHKGIKYTVQG